jgi:hypothetical protein
MRALSTLRRATKKCLTGKAGLCFREGLRELHNFRRHYSEGPSDCRRAVLRISESLLSFAGEFKSLPIIQRVSARYKGAVMLFHVPIPGF